MSKLSREDVLTICNKWHNELKVNIKRVQIRNMKRKWGSCSKNGTLTLNKELLSMPKECLEYVIVHELLHLIVPNHGRTFKTLLYVYFPKWEGIHEYLVNNDKN